MTQSADTSLLGLRTFIIPGSKREAFEQRLREAGIDHQWHANRTGPVQLQKPGHVPVTQWRMTIARAEDVRRTIAILEGDSPQ